MSDYVADNAARGGGWRVSMEETSANPRHRVFLTTRRTHSMRHILEQMSGKTMFWK